MKRIAALAIMILSVFITSCGGPQVELLDFIGNDTTDVDYNGYEFNFEFGKEAGYDEDNMIYVYNINTIQGDALLSRIQQIKDEINVNINIAQKYDIYELQNVVMSGSEAIDACQHDRFNYMWIYAKAGLLYPITDFPEYIDLSETDKYGDANALEPGMIDSVPYVVNPVSWYGFETLDSHIMTYNIDLFEKYGITNFHEFYENGTWTWKTYEDEFLKKARVETADGILPAIWTDYRSLFDILMYSNGTEFITKDENGNTEVSLAPAKMIKAYDQGAEWCKNYPDIIDLTGGLFYTEVFCQEQALSTLALAHQLTTGEIVYNQFGHSFRYNIAPFPAGPDAEYGVWAQYLQRAEGWGICKTSNDPEIAAHTISLLFEPFEEFKEQSLFDFYNSNTFISETDTEIYFELMKNVRYNYTFGPSHDIGRGVAEVFGMGMKKGMSFAEVFEKNRTLLDEMVNDYMLPNYDYMYENYYSKLETE